MKIKTKLVILFLLVSLIPLALVISIYTRSSKIILKDSIGADFARIAQEKANSIENIIEDRISEVELLAKMSQIKNIIKESNAVYQEKDSNEIMSEIKK